MKHKDVEIKLHEISPEAHQERAAAKFLQEVYGEGGRAWQELQKGCRKTGQSLEILGEVIEKRSAQKAAATYHEAMKTCQDKPVETSMALLAAGAVCAIGAVEAAPPVLIGTATLGATASLGGVIWTAGSAFKRELEKRNNLFFEKNNGAF